MAAAGRHGGVNAEILRRERLESDECGAGRKGDCK